MRKLISQNIILLKSSRSQSPFNLIFTNLQESRAICGTMYLPGVIGLNNIKANDYCNVVLQALCHVKPVRDYFLREQNYVNIKRPPGDIKYVLIFT